MDRDSTLARLRWPLALVADARLPDYPDVPTLAEAGYPGVGTTLWAGLFAPAATPQNVLQNIGLSGPSGYR